MRLWAGVDVGGTFVKLAAWDETGRRVAEVLTESGQREGSAWLGAVREGLAALERQAGAPLAGVGVSAPGLASRNESCIEFLPGRLPGVEGLHWGDFLGRRDPVPVLNDAHAALIGEVAFGAAAGQREVVLITLGTGVGGAVLSEGRLLRGHIGRAGHLGHVSVDHHGPPTIAGTPGGIELAIGNATLAARTGGRFHFTRDLAAAAQAGDAAAQTVWDESVHALATHLAGVICAFDPALIVLGGGLSELEDFLFAPLRRHLDVMEWRPRGHSVPLVKATLGAWAGSAGAACRARGPIQF